MSYGPAAYASARTASVATRRRICYHNDMDRQRDSGPLGDLVDHPEHFDTHQIDRLVQPWDPESELIDASNIRAAFFRIFDLNVYTPLGYATRGVLGRLNASSNRRRTKRAMSRLRSGRTLTKIYAEGDSWFQHPLLRDIVDHLNRKLPRKDYVVLNSALGGDWLLNYLHDRKYVEEISLFEPDVVLLSGGGNDIVGGMKLALLLGNADTVIPPPEGRSTGTNAMDSLRGNEIVSRLIRVDQVEPSDAPRLVAGFQRLTMEFVSTIWLMETAYKFLIKSIRKKYTDLRLITHGYDYPIPNAGPGSVLRPIRAILNLALNNGHWMYDPMMLRNITSPSEQRDIMFTVIYCFNEMLIRAGEHEILGRNVFHVDARRAARGPRDWFDEMHLTGRQFGIVADAFCRCIQTVDTGSKVFAVRRPGAR